MSVDGCCVTKKKRGAKFQKLSQVCDLNRVGSLKAENFILVSEDDYSTQAHVRLIHTIEIAISPVRAVFSVEDRNATTLSRSLAEL